MAQPLPALPWGVCLAQTLTPACRSSLCTVKPAQCLPYSGPPFSYLELPAQSGLIV